MSGRILVVDDDPAMVRTLCDVLELHGWETVPAHDGEAATKLLADNDIGVVLMDVRMPKLDGVGALRRIKEHYPGTRVILMTAYTAQDLLTQAVEEGALHILRKPVDIAALIRLLEAAGDPGRPLLVVDDDVEYLSTLCDVLEQHGLTTVRARTLEEALERLERDAPHAVLLDLKLDHADPEGSLLAIREVSPTVLLVLYSGHRVELARTLASARASLVDAAFTKPLPIDDLLAFLGTAST